MKKQLSYILFAAGMLAASHASAYGCTDYSTRAVATGAVAGTAVGAAVLVASGVAATVKITAAAGAVGVAIVIDCATTGCIVTLVGSAAVGIAAAVTWLANRNCSGALVATNKGTWHHYWNFDAERWLLGKVRDDYGANLKYAKMVGIFRHCGAAVVDAGGEIFFAQGKTKSVSHRRALSVCRNKSSGCEVAAARCNT